MWIVLFYLTMAVAALILTWPDRDLRWLAYALILSNITSNAVWFAGLTIERPAIYTATEIIIDMFAFLAFYFRCKHVDCPLIERLLLIGVVMASTVSVCSNVALAWLQISLADPRLTYMHTVATNICYAIECVLTMATGVAGRVRNSNISRRRDDSWKLTFVDDLRSIMAEMDKR